MIHDSIDNLKMHVGNQPIDLFICSASFEERSRSIVDGLDGLMPVVSLVAMNIRLGTKVASQCEYLVSRLGAGARTIPLDSDNPIHTADSISRVVGKALTEAPQRIVIDTTTFTRETLLILLRFLYNETKPSDTVEFLYAHAKEYSVGDPIEQKWLSKGIREVRSVLGYPGDLLPSRRNHLIILVGFEDERALNLIREFEPARISLGVGDRSESGTLPHQDVNVHKCDKLKSVLDAVEEFTFRAYDSGSTVSTLRAQVQKATGFNNIIAPMNTKISTIGAAMLAMEDESIQLCYAQPNIYNYDRYSIPDRDFYFFTIQGFPK